MYINYDYGQNHIPGVHLCTTARQPSTSSRWIRHWQGIAASAREQITANAALVVRYEYFYDNQGFATASGLRERLLRSEPAPSTKIKEFTATYEYKWAAGLLVRAEYRIDWSNKKIFNYGNDAKLSDPGTPTKDAQNTATIGLIAFFGPKR